MFGLKNFPIKLFSLITGQPPSATSNKLTLTNLPAGTSEDDLFFFLENTECFCGVELKDVEVDEKKLIQ